jgi:hypothetical protein
MQSFFVFDGGGTILKSESKLCLFSGGVIDSRHIFLKGT